MTRTAILGAGVSGLTCGVVLAEAGFDVTITAKEIEGTTSEAAAALWYPYHIAPGTEEWARVTREVLVALADDRESGVSLVDFELLDTGERMRVPLMDTTRYLPYLRRRFGGAIVRREVRAFRELDADLVVNCAGFGSRELCRDDALEPGYGVSLVTPAISIHRAVAATSDPDALTYVIPRQGDCVLGGYDKPTPPDDAENERILARCRAVVPELSSEIRVIRRGIRPIRSSVRLQRETIDGVPVIHNYGHGGAGFTVSWGCGFEVRRMAAALQKVIAPLS